MKGSNEWGSACDCSGMPLRLVIPLPGPFFWVSSGGRKRRGPRVWPWAVLVLVLAAVVYAATLYWWVGVIVAVVVLAALAALFAGAVPAGGRARTVRALLRRPNTADRAEATRLLDEHIARHQR